MVSIEKVAERQEPRDILERKITQRSEDSDDKAVDFVARGAKVSLTC